VRTQFWPFTHLLPKILAGAAKKVWESLFFLTRLRLKSYGGQAADFPDITGENPDLKPQMNQPSQSYGSAGTNSHELRRQKPFTRIGVYSC
jgi:hypothetical protein